MKLRNAVTVALTCGALAGAGPIAFAKNTNQSSVRKMTPTPAASSKQDHVKEAASNELYKRRKALVKEAVAANDEMVRAVMALNQKDTKKAFKLLEQADGQLNVVLARDPHLTLAPIGVRASLNDLEGTSGQVHKEVEKAKKELDKGDVQDARAALLPIASEMRIATDYIPLEVYPDSIKKASQEIQAGKLDDAKLTLAAAMSSIVTIEDVIPLPPIKAEGDVLHAEGLIKMDKAKYKDAAEDLLKSADDQLAFATALGYGPYKEIRDQIKSVKSDIASGTVKPNAFDRLKHLLHELTHKSAQG